MTTRTQRTLFMPARYHSHSAAVKMSRRVLLAAPAVLTITRRAAGFGPAFTSLAAAATPVLDFMGPALTVSEQVGLGGRFAAFELNFARFEDEQWLRHGSYWLGGNDTAGYDRPATLYVWADRVRRDSPATASRYSAHANALLVDFREGYLAKNDFNIPYHLRQPYSLLCHYLVTADPASLSALGRDGDMFAHYIFPSLSNTSRSGFQDNRLQAFCLMALIGCSYADAPSVGVRGRAPGGNVWREMLPQALSAILSTQAIDGAYRFDNSGQYNRAVPFMTAILNAALIDYYRLVGPDQRILRAIKKAADWVWTEMLDPIGVPNTFFYIEATTPSEARGRSGSADLVGFWLVTFAWLFWQTGDLTYRNRAVALLMAATNNMSGRTEGAGINQTKQFNELYSRAGSYSFYHSAAPLRSATAPVNARLPSISTPNGFDFECQPGTWIPQDGIEYLFRWKRDTRSAVDSLPTTDVGLGAKYRATAADRGHGLFCVVSASTVDGVSAPARSDFSSAVTP
jgi:hypothetical protein